MSDQTQKKTLTDTQITTRVANRRGFMGLMAAGGVAGALLPAQAYAQGTDADNGALTDRSGCGRGGGGINTGASDSDSGNITDSPGWGRGQPYC